MTQDKKQCVRGKEKKKLYKKTLRRRFDNCKKLVLSGEW